jgi:hypothetical protein
MAATYNRDVRISAISHAAGTGSRPEHIADVEKNVFTDFSSSLTQV